MCDHDMLESCCKKKKSTPGIVQFFAWIGGFVVANIAGSAAVYVRNMSKMKKSESQFNAMHSVTLGKNVVNLSKDIQNVYISCMSGIADINFNEDLANDDVYLDIVSVLGKVTVNVPINVKVVFDGDAICEQIKNSTLDMEDEDVPTLHIIRHSAFAKLVVRPFKN